jgi:hypothetical protein
MRSPVLEQPALQSLCDGMHTLAQPLMLLQSRLEMARILQEDRDAARLSASLAVDVDRACASFHQLMELIARLGSKGVVSTPLPAANSWMEGEVQ